MERLSDEVRDADDSGILPLHSWADRIEILEKRLQFAQSLLTDNKTYYKNPDNFVRFLDNGGK